MKLGIITDSIREKSTGIGNYTKDLVLEIFNIDKKNKYFFIDYLETSFNNKNLFKISNPFKYFKTYLWHNLIPLRTRNIDANYILNFSAVPHLIPFKQKEIFFVYDISWYLYPEYHPSSRVLFYRSIFKRCLDNAYLIAVDSISTKMDLVKIFSIAEEKIHVIYPSYIDEFKDISPKKFKYLFPYILYIGTLEPRKNIMLIVNAYWKLKQEYGIKHKLVLCGKKGWLYKDIFSLIKLHKLEEDVIYLGYITDEEKKYLYKNADFFVYPSMYEGFGIPVLEAMTYGCPVITSNVSSLPEVAGNAAIKISPESLEQLVEGMHKLIKDEKLRLSLKEEGYKQVKRLNNTDQIETLLKSIK